MKNLLSILLILTTSLIIAQPRTGPNNSITGKVLDKYAKVPLEYSNIVLFAKSDSSQTNGTVTNSEGIFSIKGIRPGEYYIRVSFIGYESTFINDISIQQRTNIDLGEIYLSAESFSTDDVVISGDRAAVSYQIDKKVINVEEQITSLSGSAVDVLENVPSVTVDIEGNVSLRGSTSFTVLIDGKPSILESSEALEQIPASSIQNIEIITNPSAKYDPEGTSGIINVITKKNSLNGFSGVANLNIGTGDKYGGDFLIDYKTEVIDFSIGLDYRKRNMEMESETENWTLYNGTRYYNNSTGDFTRGRDGYGIKSAFSLNATENDIITLNGRYGFRKGSRFSDLNYDEYTDQLSAIEKYTTYNDRYRKGDFYSTGLNYIHNFETKDHKLTADLIYQFRNGDEHTLFKQYDLTGAITEGQEQTEKGPSGEYEIKIDYTYPISDVSKFEAGYNGEIENSEDNSRYYNYNLGTANFDLVDSVSNDTKYLENNHAIYTMYSNEFNNLGMQIGLRTEYTGQEVELSSTNESFVIDRWDFFPSAHLSYKLNTENQFMTSYTRRIERPRGWQLEPFLTWMDPYNVRRGNPELEPEYIDSYELSYQKLFDKSIFSAELYYRITNGKREYIQSAYGENVTLHSVDNVGKDFSLGTELMFNFDPMQMWNVNLMGNLYDYRIEGQLGNISFDRQSFNWNVRFNNTLKVSQNTSFQLNVFYNSPTVSAQGSREEFYMVNAGARQILFGKKLAITLQIRDILGTAKREFSSSSSDYYRYNNFVMEAPVVMLNLRYNFNNYKSNSRNGNGDSEGGGIEGGDDF